MGATEAQMTTLLESGCECLTSHQLSAEVLRPPHAKKERMDIDRKKVGLSLNLSRKDTRLKD
jgi:hypothetical protein